MYLYVCMYDRQSLHLHTYVLKDSIDICTYICMHEPHGNLEGGAAGGLVILAHL